PGGGFTGGIRWGRAVGRGELRGRAAGIGGQVWILRGGGERHGPRDREGNALGPDLDAVLANNFRARPVPLVIGASDREFFKPVAMAQAEAFAGVGEGDDNLRALQPRRPKHWPRGSDLAVISVGQRPARHALAD